MQLRQMIGAMWRNRTGPLLVALQVALALAIVVNVAYIIEQRVSLLRAPTGMDLDNMFWIASQGQAADYNQGAAVTADLQYLSSLPGVTAAATISMLPQTFGAIVLPFSAAPEELQHRDGGVQARIYFGSAKMLEALGLTLIAGRTFDANSVMPPAADMNAAMGAWAPEMVITKAMADRLFPQGSALGKTVYVGLVNRSATVVGVVERMQGAPLGGAAQSLATQIVLLPIQPFGKSALYVVRTRAGSRDAVMARVEAEFANLRDGRYVRRVESFTTTAANARSGYRSSSIMLGVASFLVVAVALVGIAGLAAFNVTTRTRQLGTRRAVGATRMDVVRYFLVENWLITSGGALLGCALGLAAGMRLSTAYQMPRLPLYYLVAGVLAVWVLGLLAVLVPARRAASIPPAIATRMA